MSCKQMQSETLIDSIVELQFPAFASRELVAISPAVNI